MRTLIAWWRCRRDCRVEFHNGHPWAVYYCDRPACPVASWVAMMRVNP